MEKKLYPFRFIPVASKRPWGGHDLMKKLGKEFYECDDEGNEVQIPADELIGESWEIADMGVEDSVGYGMITATTGQVQYTDANYQILQTDIFGSKDATGVLFNLQGEVIGIITNHKSENMENVIMAYGISDLKKRMEKLSNNESIPYIGLQ